MVEWPARLRSSPLPDENRASAELFIARLRVVVSVYCLVLTVLGGDGFGFYRRGGVPPAGVFSLFPPAPAPILSPAAPPQPRGPGGPPRDNHPPPAPPAPPPPPPPPILPFSPPTPAP